MDGNIWTWFSNYGYSFHCFKIYIIDNKLIHEVLRIFRFFIKCTVITLWYRYLLLYSKNVPLLFILYLCYFRDTLPRERITNKLCSISRGKYREIFNIWIIYGQLYRWHGGVGVGCVGRCGEVVQRARYIIVIQYCNSIDQALTKILISIYNSSRDGEGKHLSTIVIVSSFS